MADIFTGGTPSVSPAVTSGSAAQIFDNDLGLGAYWSPFTNPTIIKYDLGAGNGKIAVKFRWANKSTATQGTVKDATFEGSNNDADWTVLFTVTAAASGGTGWQALREFSNSTSYRYYRLKVTAENGEGGGDFSIYELEAEEQPPITITPLVGSISISGLASILGAGITPLVGSLILTGYQAGMPILIIPSVGSLVLVGETPTVLGIFIFPSTGSLSLSGLTPILGTEVVPSVGSLVMTGQGATLVFGLAIEPGTGSLSLTGLTPILISGLIIQPSVGGLSLVGVVPTLDSNIFPLVGSLITTGQIPPLGANIVPPSGSLVLTGRIPVLDSNIYPFSGDLSIAGLTSILNASITPSVGSLIITGQISPLGTNIFPSVGNLTLVGQTPILGLIIVPGVGQLIITGLSAVVGTFVSSLLIIPYESLGPLATYDTIPWDLVGFSDIRFMLRTNTQLFESPLSGATQTLELSGAKWESTLIIPPMKQANARQWLAFLAKLRGAQGRFYAGDPAARTPRGTNLGAPLIDGAGQTGVKINTKNWTASSNGVLKKGDFVAWDSPTGWREMHMATDDVNSDSAGKATINISPPIRESPVDGAILMTKDPTCIMRLLNDEQTVWGISRGNLYEMSFTATEVFK